MAVLVEQISVTKVIKEIRELIPCELCGKMATGFYGEQVCCNDHGVLGYEDGQDNPFFKTRNNLLQIAERCYRAEQGLSEVTELAKKCEETYKTYIEGGGAQSIALNLRGECKELWEAVIDLDISSETTTE